jgi:N-acetylmuramoyl-L-alanine amidase
VIAILDRQHKGRLSKPLDRGAACGLLRETDLTDAYIAAAKGCLESAGATVHVLDTGEYGDRHRAAIAIAKAHPTTPCAYIACHVNAGKGTYALVEYDARSAGGRSLASDLNDWLVALPGITKGKTFPMTPATRGWACIDGIYAGPSNLSAALLEPGFIDAPAHAPLWTLDGLQRVGKALSEGILMWGHPCP